jgi:hypothetical protein
MNPTDSQEVSIDRPGAKKSGQLYVGLGLFFRQRIHTRGLAFVALAGMVLLAGLLVRSAAAQSPAGQTTISVSSIIIPTHPADNALVYHFNPTYNMYYAQLDNLRYNPYRLENRTYNLIVLENNYLKLTLLPELGGRIYQVIFKPTGNNMFYQNPVIKPTHWGPPEMGWWVAAGGMEWGLPVEEHGYEWGLPWSYRITDLPDGAMVEVWDSTASNRIRANVAITLPDNAAFFRVSPTLENPTAVPVDFKFWINAMVAPGPGNNVGENLRFIWPAEQVTVHSTDDSRLPAAGQAAGWPRHNGVDWSKLGNWRQWYGFFQRPQSGGNFQAVYDEDYDEGVVRVYDSNISKGAKFFGHGYGVLAIAPDNYTDGNSGYVEIHGGLAPTFADTHRLAARRSVSWTEHWYPVAGLKSLTWANEKLALHVEKSGDKARLSVAFTQAVKNARVLVLRRANNEVLYQAHSLEVSPGSPYHSEMFTMANLSTAEVAVLVYQNDTLLGAYQYNGGELLTPTPVATATPTATSTPTSTATPVPSTSTSSPTPTSTFTPTPIPTSTPSATFSPTPVPTSTATPIPTSTPTSPTTSSWLGRIRRVVPIAGGASVVRIWVEDKPGLPVTIRSDLARWYWQATGYTGSKLEYGPDALEFAPLPPIPYTIIVPDLAVQFSFALPAGSITEIVFSQSNPPVVIPVPLPVATATPRPSPTPVAPPATLTPSATLRPTSTATPTSTSTPTPTVAPGWQVRVPQNMTVPGNWFAVIRVSVEEKVGVPVRITIVTDDEDPWSVTCRTGSKPEYGPYFCEFSPLIPAEYIISLDEFNVATTLKMERGGVAVVIFEEN